MMQHWKDISSFSSGEKDRTPKTWSCITGSSLRLVVTRHIDAPGRWVVRCEPYFNFKTLDSLDVEDAKVEAVKLVLMYLKDDVQTLEDVLKAK